MSDVARRESGSILDEIEDAVRELMVAPSAPTPRVAQRFADLAVRLSRVSQLAGYGLARCLAIVRDNKLYLYLAGSEQMTFARFVEEIVGISVRRAGRELRAFDRLEKAGVSPADVMEIGWQRAKEIAPVVTPETAQIWVERARAVSSVAVLRQEVADVRSGRRPVIDPDAVERTSWKVELTPDQRRVLYVALERAQEFGRRRGAELSYGEALDLIVTDWLANNVLDAQDPLAWHIQRLSEAYRVDITWAAAPRGAARTALEEAS